MERRFVIFLVLSFGILSGYYWLMQQLHPPRPRVPQDQAQAAADQKKPKAGNEKDKPKAEKAEKAAAEKTASKPAKTATAIQAAPEPEVSEQWISLGSADAESPYRMLVTLTNRGAAVARIELNSPYYCDIDYRGGYLGHLMMDPKAETKGCVVQVVGPGTPAAEAGLKPGDVITSIDDKPVADYAALENILSKKLKPKQTVGIIVLREGHELVLTAKLRRRPLEVVRPEVGDPLSMLTTLQQWDDQKLGDIEKKAEEICDQECQELAKEEVAAKKEILHHSTVRHELDGVALRDVNWKLVESDATHARFRRALPKKGLEVFKTYRLANVPEASVRDGNYPAYHLEFEIEIRNADDKAHKVAYRLDGPNNLPTEGKWYSSKVSRNWGGAGLRDYIVSFGGSTPEMTGAMAIADGTQFPPRPDTPDKMLTFVGVDAQYFSAVLMPLREKPTDIWLSDVQPIRLGKVDPQHKNLANTSCRLTGAVQELQPGGSMVNCYKFFAGPKKPALLENKDYRLGELVYFGWPIFAAVAVPLTWILHGFYSITWNYGLAIILLTVLVRGCMFPLSRKQALGAQKMQELQPEIKKIQEKFKNNLEGRQKAQQELFRKHNYNPLAGCLPVFIQMPVFIGLYRSLMVAIELRDAPLLSNSIRWCSNLAAPDMLFDWHAFMPAFIVDGPGLFWLGPYFNLLPILTIILFIWQQKMFMPPPADEQAAMQQKIMQYMMIFMGVMFFKVASGLCIYFIASSLWGMAERKFLPKTTPVAANGSNVETRAEAKARMRAEAEAAEAKKNRGKK